ncbi:DUF397 domain-containing protein [Streptomyces sp. SID10853]|uniref:DUF397 domain-containing protein n=1 Tax=Streptomyces sp. SID10853 TaxID=2706028 RepID=UPI0013BF9EB9|nr:DUF397 domain-containing protein [Streptomyces sp. SID10853]NDZ79054.1 DUF397 domain-containing protein [Streptomyces sp. SID10853]
MTRTFDCDLSTATWQKSSYSDGSGGNCVELARKATWRKSTYSGGDGGNCLEVADHFPGTVPVRDSKDPAGPALVFRATAWAAFVTHLRNV